MIDWDSQPGTSLVTSRLRIDERVLHFLTRHPVSRRAAWQAARARCRGPACLIASIAAREIAAAWALAAGQPPVIQLHGADPGTRQAIAAAASSSHGLSLYILAAEHVPGSAAELDAFLRLWEREVRLGAVALCIEADVVDRSDAKAVAQVSRLLESVSGAVMLAASDRWRPLRRPTLSIEARKPTAEEQTSVWQVCWGNHRPSSTAR